MVDTLLISLEVRTIKIKRNFSAILVVIILMSLVSVNYPTIASSTKESNINLNFRGVELRDAFRAIANIADMNIITDSSVKGTVTVDLKGLSYLEAINLLVKTNGLDYRIVGNTVLIGNSKNLKENFDQKETKVFKLYHSEPKEVKAGLELVVDSNSIKVDERTKSIMVFAYPDEIERIGKLIKDLDEAKKQVIIEARIEDINRDKLKSMGIDWSFAAKQSSTGSNITWDSISPDVENVLEVGDVAMDYTSVLRMLHQDGDSTTLAKPHISTIDGKEAMINIGQEVPIVKKNNEDEVEFEFRNVGTILRIKPRVDNNNKVLLELKPEVSSVADWEAGYPILDTKKLETNVIIESGNTIAIGGLISDKQIESLSKVPLLGDVPLLGQLFRNREVTNEKRELVIFITPRIVDNSKESKVSNDIDKKTFKYLVKRSDTLWNIGKAFNISFAKIMNYNNIESPKMLELGQILKIPVPANRYYVVAKNDDLRSLAKRYNVGVDDIKRINNLETLEGKAGESIVLPVAVK
ncbi:LysM peptidoglycan-binding domain-containing protein [Orenia marismortui]|uniref:Type IV pilus assembly protein PilQ n=1 Tax=Orenia marismortui TaxID=46469 RepID=A0A4R8H6D0_9FIRM|nr:LysM peptidoglycan-binding domain-containing protein [Orenia marismortui]TDX53026.1 type IV pilus assembly protein PilQ [Orenia marismortui]